jgi:hypothetical protein
LCVYGLNSDNSLTVALTRPDGSQAGNASLRSEFQGTFSTLIQNQPFAERLTGFSIPSDPIALALNLWLPAGLPAGKWKIQLRTENGDQATGIFTVKANIPLPAFGLTKPHIGVYPAKANPFNVSQVDKLCYPINRGNTVSLFLVNLRPETNYLLGVYRPDPNDEKKVDRTDTIAFITNRKGNQTLNLQLKDNLDPGPYHILLPTNPGTDSFWDVGPSVCVDVQ